MNLQEFLDATKHQLPRMHVVCNDGFMVSIQASRHHYCYPRKDRAAKYSSLEVGFLEPFDSKFLLELDYSEGVGSVERDVYGFVPVHIIETMLNRHGGINANLVTSQLMAEELTS